MSAPVEAIRQVIEPAITSAGLVLEDLDVRGTRNAIVRVTVDLPEITAESIGFEQVDAVTAQISQALDAEPRATENLSRYTLEVMSPGAERKLEAPRHWKRSIGRLVAGALLDGKNFEGRIISASDTHAELEMRAGEVESRPYSEITRAKVRLEFQKRGKADA